MNNTEKQLMIAGGVLAIGAGAAFYVFRTMKGETTLKPPLVNSVLPYPITKKVVSNGFRSTHRGIDIKTKMIDGAPNPDGVPTVGVPLLSPFAGEVKSVFRNDLGGLQLLLRSTDGFVAGFAHLDSIDVQPGDPVEAGQIVGATGNSGVKPSGEGYPPHLHFTLRSPDNKLLDPAAFFGV